MWSVRCRSSPYCFFSFRGGGTRDGAQSHACSHTTDNLDMTVRLQHMSFGPGGGNRSTSRTPGSMGRTRELHARGAEAGLAPPTEANVLTAKPTSPSVPSPPHATAANAEFFTMCRSYAVVEREGKNPTPLPPSSSFEGFRVGLVPPV